LLIERIRDLKQKGRAISKAKKRLVAVIVNVPSLSERYLAESTPVPARVKAKKR